eukprot:TRINITY_DN26962_c0_g2_i3.p2 TRINITY_DN26962_c0_g2~~TRINITY_DN26962_c0_g2_i3.p2  ORF type:complete len:112 (+),score=2.79 TRINITY_DN26962_c0_g2_i3:325-660(+)
MWCAVVPGACCNATQGELGGGVAVLWTVPKPHVESEHCVLSAGSALQKKWEKNGGKKQKNIASPVCVCVFSTLVVWCGVQYSAAQPESPSLARPSDGGFLIWDEGAVGCGV